MFKKRMKLICGIMVISLAIFQITGCGSDQTEADNGTSSESIETSDDQEEASTSDTTGTDGVSTADAVMGMITVEYSDPDLDDSWSEDSAVKIVCSGSDVSIEGTGASYDGTNITISAAGTYVMSGELTDGQIRIDVTKNDKVKLVLNNASLNCSTSAAIYGIQSDKIILTLAEGSSNTVTDGTKYTFEDETNQEPNGAIFSKDDLTINGTGSLSVTGNFNHGIFSKDDLRIISGTFDVKAVNDGLKGKDSVAVKDGTITIQSEGDGIQSSNAEEADKGYVAIEGGTIKIDAQLDGIQAENILQVTGGEITITTGGGSANSSTNTSGQPQEGWGQWGADAQTESTESTEEESTSAKGLKAEKALYVTSGKTTIDSSDDSIHSNGSIEILSGEIELSSGDDGVHADAAVVIDGGDITVSKSYEGIEGKSITVNDGTIHVTASDDGFNAAGGNDSSSVDGRAGQNDFAADGEAFVQIAGGYIWVDASGDGLDSNGDLAVSGGVVLVNGPVNGGNGALDYAGNAEISGGIVGIAGSQGMAQTFDDTSTQNSIMVYYSNVQSAGTLVNLLDESGKTLFSFAPSKEYQTIVISTPEIETGKTYTLTGGGTTEGESTDGFYADGSSTGGTTLTEISVESTATKISDTGEAVSGSMGGGMGGGRGNGGERPGGGKRQPESGEIPNGEMPNGEMPSGEMPEDLPSMDGAPEQTPSEESSEDSI